MAQKLTNIIQAAGGQCSKTRPAVVWLELLDLGAPAFERLAKFSMESQGGGLNAIFARSFDPRVDRRHIAQARFSVRPEQITIGPALDAAGMLTTFHSLDGQVYAVPNPNCVFPAVEGL